MHTHLRYESSKHPHLISIFSIIFKQSLLVMLIKALEKILSNAILSAFIFHFELKIKTNKMDNLERSQFLQWSILRMPFLNSIQGEMSEKLIERAAKVKESLQALRTQIWDIKSEEFTFLIIRQVLLIDSQSRKCFDSQPPQFTSDQSKPHSPPSITYNHESNWLVTYMSPQNEELSRRKSQQRRRLIDETGQLIKKINQHQTRMQERDSQRIQNLNRLSNQVQMLEQQARQVSAQRYSQEKRAQSAERCVEIKKPPKSQKRINTERSAILQISEFPLVWENSAYKSIKQTC